MQQICFGVGLGNPEIDSLGGSVGSSQVTSLVWSRWFFVVRAKNAYASLRKGNWRDAKRAYEAILEGNAKTRAEWHYQLGVACENLKEWGRARTAYEVATYADPSQATWFYRLGKTCEKLRDWNAARAAYEAAISGNPEQAQWYYRLEFVCGKLKDWPAAWTARQAALQRDKHSDALRLKALYEKAEFEVCLADVGAADQVSGRWDALADRLTMLAFDPREESIAVDDVGYKKISYPVALGRDEGSATLYVSKVKQMSSLLEPNSDLLKVYMDKERHVQQMAQEEVKLTSLDKLMSRASVNIDVLKIDTQGTELDILMGAEQVLTSSIFLVEAEVSFFERYKQQPLFGDVCSYMERLGFQFADFFHSRRYYRKNALGVMEGRSTRLARGGRLALADAIFIRPIEALSRRLDQEESGDHFAIKVVAVLLAYGKIDWASSFVDEVAGKVTRETNVLMSDLLLCSGRKFKG